MLGKAIRQTKQNTNEITAQDIAAGVERKRKNSGYSNVTAQDIAAGVEKKRNSPAYRRPKNYGNITQQAGNKSTSYMQQDSMQSSEKMVSVKNSTSNTAYVKEQMAKLSDSQKSAIENYNKYMKLYNSSGLSYVTNGMADFNNATSYLNKALAYKKNSGLDGDEFDNYASNWEQYNDLIKSEEYKEKSAAMLELLSDEQREELNRYNQADQQYQADLIQSAIGAVDINKTTTYNDVLSSKNAYMKKYGVSSEEFDRLAQYVKEDMDKMSMDVSLKQIEDDIKEDPVKYGAMYSVLNILTSPVAGMLAAGESLKSLGYADKDAPINTNSSLYALQNVGTATEAAVLEEIDNPVGQFAYNAGMSTAKSAMGMLSGNRALSLASFGANAYSSTLKNAQDKGVSKERAILSAIPAGLAETGFELTPLDDLYDIYRTAGKSALKDTVKRMVVHSGIEGVTEVGTELTNVITDAVVNGNLSDYGMRVRQYQENGSSEDEAKGKATWDSILQVAEAGALGFVSGGILGGAATVGSKANYVKLGKSINQDAEVKTKVIEAAQEMGENTTAKEIVTSTKAEDITDAQMAQVIESMADVDAGKVNSILAEIAPVQSVIDEKVMDSENQQFDNKTMRFDNGKTENGTQSVENGTLQKLAEEMTRKEKTHGITRATVMKTNEPVIAVKFDEVSKDKATVRLGNDTVVSLDEVQMEDRTMQNLYGFASSMNDTKAANAMLDRYEGQPLNVYAQACASFYNAGQLKTASFEELVENPKNADLVAGMGNTATLYEMYSLGQNAAEIFAPVQQNVVKGPVQEGRVIDNRLDKQESRILPLAELVAKRTGLEITLNDSLENGERGHFQAAMGRIALSSKADNQYEALVHELQEYASTYNPEKMQKVYDKVLNYAMSDMGVKRLTEHVKAYQNAYERVEQGKSYKSASEEFVHDYIAGMFMTPEGVQELVEFMQKENVPVEEQRSILQTIADFFKDIAKKIREYIDEHSMSRVAKSGMEADAKRAEEMRQMVLEVLEDTIGSELETENNRVSYSINPIPDTIQSDIESNIKKVGNMSPVITIRDNVFNKGTMKLSEQVEQYFNSLGNNAYNEVIGDVELNHAGIKSDIAHGLGRIKAVTFKAVPSVIKNGQIVDYQTNWKGRDYDTVVLAAPINVQNRSGVKDEYFMAVIVIRAQQHKKQRFYVHEAIAIKKEELLFKTSIDAKSNKETGNSPSFIYSILQKVANYNESEEKRNKVNTAGNSSSNSNSKLDLVRDSSASNNIRPQTSKNTTKKSLKVELTEDSLGRKLSEEQIEYFKDSKVRDENGALKAVYHGTKADFTVFDINKNKVITFGNGFYFGENQDAVNSFYAGENGRVMENYLNITNPFVIEQSQLKDIDAAPNVVMETLGIEGVTKASIMQVLKEHGYDGIHYKREINGNDVYVAFDSSQAKNVDNLKPTKNPDIRLSLDVDLMSIMDEEYSQEENESASIIEEGFTSLQNVTVDKKTMHKLAWHIKRDYKSAYSIDDLTNNLTNVFAYLKEHPKANYQDMIRIMQEVAKPVIEESTDIDTWEKAYYDNFRNYFKGKTIKLNRIQREEVAHYFGSFENFRRKNFGSIQFSATNGTPLDNLWEEIVQQSNFMLESDTVSADQPIALMDVMQALKPVKKNIYGMNTEQTSYDLALDIFRQFFAEQAQEKANEKVVKKALRLVERQQEYRKRVHREFEEAKARIREYDKEKREQLRREYDIKLRDAKKSMEAAMKDKDWKAVRHYEVMEEGYKEQIRKLNQKADEKILAIKAANRQNMANRRLYEEQKRVRERIVRNAKGIINYFNSNTDKRHIPEALKTPIAEFITSIDFINAGEDTKTSLAWRESLNSMYVRLSNKKIATANGFEEIYEALNDERGTKDVLNDMSAFLDSCFGKGITDLSVRELEQLDGIITALKRAITDINRLYVNKRTQNVTELGMQSIEQLRAKKDKKSHTVLVEKGINLMDANMLDSRSYFDRLGDAAFSIYDELRTAFNERVWKLKEAQDYMTKVLDGLDVKEWTGEKAKVHDFVINGQHLQMTTAQIMSLYELNKRNQAKLHMTVGGIRPTVIGKGSKAIKRVTAVKLTSRDIDIICDFLTAEQKQVADKMQKFLSENCAKWGNKASMQMYGYERFGAKNYFPIRTDGNTVDTKDDSKFWATKNQGFTKETVKNASNPLIVSDIFEVFTKHVTDMASYSAYSAPLMDAMKWYNFRNTDLAGDIVVYDGSVKTEIERAYGDTYLTYFKKLIEDINAENKRGIESEIAELLTSNMKAASVGANLRVAIQQPTAYLRAAAVMEQKYLAKAVFKKSAMKKAKENSAITLWKSWGYFETSIGRSMQNVLTNQQTRKEWLVDKSMTMAQFMDDFTWGYLWNACELEISEKYKNVKYDSPEYIQLVSKRFDEVVDQTQVVDTVLHKSHIMRSNKMFDKMVTSFMSEPTKSYNLLMNRIRDVYEGKKGAKKFLSKAVKAYMVTQVLNALIVSVVDAYRDWDEDETFWEKYFTNFKENLVDNMNPLSIIPYAKDIVSLLQGYEVKRQDMQGISTLVNGGRKIAKYITDEEYRSKHTLWEVCKELVKGGSQVYGVPAFNLLRDIEAIWNTHFPKFRIGGRIYSKTENYSQMIDALLAGDEEAYNRAYDDRMSKGDIEDNEVSGYVLSQIKKQYDDGQLTQEQVEKLLKEEYGYSDDDIWYKFNREWTNGSKYGLLYENIDYAFSTGNISDRATIRTEIDELKKHGAESSDIAAGITRKYKEQYLELLSQNKAANMKNLLISCFMFCGYTRDEAMKKIEKWSE